MVTKACDALTTSKDRRPRLAGASHVFAINPAARGSDRLVTHIDMLRRACLVTAMEHMIHCDAMVILLDHLHAVWTLPADDSNFLTRWRKIKARFTRWAAERGDMSASKVAKQEAGVWQRRFWEHAIRDEADHAAHVGYCWGNPVKHGLVAWAEDWPYSSIHRDIRAGIVGLMAAVADASAR